MKAINQSQALSTDCFFIEGDDCAKNYRLTRDLPKHKARKKHIEDLWIRHKPYADSHFRQDAKNHLLQRYWEMHLAVTLLDKGFELTKHQDEGPDICTEISDRRFWFEATAPTGGEGADRVSKPKMSKAYRVDPDKIALRFTNALDEKEKAYRNAYAEGIIKEEDGYVIGINSAGIDSGSDRDILPYWLRGFLPLGPLTVSFNKTTARISEKPYYQYQKVVSKASGAEVHTDNFLHKHFRFCSAILHSSATWMWPENPLGIDFEILHNPLAAHPLDQTMFSWCTQYTVEEIVGDSRIDTESEIRIRILEPES